MPLIDHGTGFFLSPKLEVAQAPVDSIPEEEYRAYGFEGIRAGIHAEIESI
jgi:hypothetical protein